MSIWDESTLVIQLGLPRLPDSKFLWVGVSGHNETAVVDIEKQEVIKRFPVGQAPKRIFTAIMPQDWEGESD